MDFAEFDQFADEYHNLHQGNIRITRDNPEYFAEYKICDLKRVAKIVGVNVNNILYFERGFGNKFPFLAKQFPRTCLFGTDVSNKSLTLAKERFDGVGEFSLFDGKRLPYPEGQFDLALATSIPSYSRRGTYTSYSRSFPSSSEWGCIYDL